MKELQEMAGIISKYRLKKVEIINNSLPKPGKKSKQSRDSKAYHALVDEKITTDEEMAEYLGFKGNGNAFAIFKHRFSIKLQNGMFFIDTKLSSYYDAEYLCSRLRHLVFMLFLYGRRNAAVHFAKKMLGIAEEYNLAEHKLFCYKRLRGHFSYIGDDARYLKYSGLYNLALEQMVLEDKAEDYMNRINVQHAPTIVRKPETAIEAFGYADEIGGYLKTHDTPILQYYEHKLRGFGYQIDGEYEKSNVIWRAWEKYLLAHPLFSGDKRLGEVAVYQMDNYTYMFQYDESKKFAITCMKRFREDSPNRLIFFENYFLLAMRSGDYINARDIFKLATGNKRLRTMPATNQEKWKIFKAYLYFAENAKGIIGRNTFDLEDLAKSIHVYKEDKAGFNIALLIVQKCILIKMAPDRPIDQMDALKLYKKRYLKTDVSYRVNVFMDLLFALDKANYSPLAMKETEALLLKKLKGKPMAHTENIEGLEVIPFERLWEMVKEHIKEQK